MCFLTLFIYYGRVRRYLTVTTKNSENEERYSIINLDLEGKTKGRLFGNSYSDCLRTVRGMRRLPYVVSN